MKRLAALFAVFGALSAVGTPAAVAASPAPQADENVLCVLLRFC